MKTEKQITNITLRFAHHLEDDYGCDFFLGDEDNWLHKIERTTEPADKFIKNCHNCRVERDEFDGMKFRILSDYQLNKGCRRITVYILEADERVTLMTED